MFVGVYLFVQGNPKSCTFSRTPYFWNHLTQNERDFDQNVPTWEWEWEWKGVGMNVDVNGNDPYIPMGKKFLRIVYMT